jgi:hypothetical protein
VERRLMRRAFVKGLFSIAASVKLWPVDRILFPLTLRLMTTARGSCFSSRSARSRPMMG